MCSPLLFFAAADLVFPDVPVLLVKSDSQGVGESIEITHHADKGRCIHDVFIGEAMASQSFQIFGPAAMALEINLVCEIQQRPGGLIHRCFSIVFLDGLGQLPVSQLSTEKLSVSFHSVMALIAG